MNENVTKIQVIEAMRERIRQGAPFQAKHLTAIGEALVDAQFVRNEGVYVPISRIADRLLQACRKVGAISFKGGTWTRNERFPLPEVIRERQDTPS